MPQLKSFTKLEQQQALRLLREGVGDEIIAEKFGVKRDTIYRLRKRMDFASPAKQSAHRQVKFRLSEDEYRAFVGLALEAGCKSNAEFARVLARSAAGFVEISREKSDALDEIRGELHKIGVNVNQIARAANARKVDLVTAQWGEIRQLVRDVGALRTYLNGIVAEARRKGSRWWRKSEYGHE